MSEAPNEAGKIQQEFTSLVSSIDKKIATLDEKEKRWALLDAVMDENQNKCADMIALNIGGKKFTTSKSTLLAQKGTFFDAMLSSGRWKPYEKSRYFIDRDPKLFPVILNYLRTGKLNLDRYSYDVTEELKTELNFYLIDIPELNKTFSKLITNQHQDQIFEWLGNSKVAPVPLYVASKDGYGTEIFHFKCDLKGPTLVLYQSTEGYLFGGYAPVSWDSSNSYKSGSSAFIFTLTNPHNMPPTRLMISNTHQQYAINCSTSYGPSFGGGIDIFIPNNSNTTNCSYTPHTYLNHTGKETITFTGSQHFTLTEIEVYSVIQKPGV